MPGAELLLSFLAVTVALAVIPGPAVMYIVAQTLARGRRAGLVTVLGTHLGCYVHVAAATLGLTTLLQLVPTAYLALKIVGALYLVWLGIGMFRAGANGTAASPIGGRGARRVFIDSILVQVLNPKVAVFFLAFLPQFADPTASLPVAAQLLILGTAVNVIFSASDVTVVFAAAAVSRRLASRETVQRWFRRAAGTVLIGLGVRLAIDRT